MNSATTFAMLGVLYALLAWVMFSVTSTAARKQRSPLGIPAGAQALRFMVCGALIFAAGSSCYWSADGVLTGKILEGNYTRYISNHFYTVYRANEPDRFWQAVSEDGFAGLLFLYFAAAEIFITVKRSRLGTFNK